MHRKKTFLAVATTMVLFSSCARREEPATIQPSPEEQMERQNMAATSRLYEEVFNQGRVDVVDALIDSSLIEHEEFPGLEPGREGLKQFVAKMRTAFPDLRVTVDDMFAKGDKVVARITISGTHQGDFAGMAPTGKTFEVGAIDIVRFAGGKCVEHWGISDHLTMMQQLGIAPTPAGH